MAETPIDPAGGTRSPLDDIFVGHSEMAGLMRQHDWAATPLGPPERWPEALKVALRILLTSRFDMWLGWGPDVAFFYNDAYRPTLGLKHPQALAVPTRQLWAEIWDDIKDRIGAVYEHGEASWDRALLLVLERSGYPEETYHTFSYSPLLGDTGRVEGLFCAVSEDTERVLSERRLATLSALSAGLAASDSRARALRAAELALCAASRDLPFALVYLFNADGSAGLACACGISRGHPLAPHTLAAGQPAAWGAAQILAGRAELQVALDAAAASPHHGLRPGAVPGMAGLGSAPPTAGQAGALDAEASIPSGAWPLPPQRAVVHAIGGQGGNGPVGFLVAALNRYRPADAALLNFVRLIAGQISSALANADAYEAERRRTAQLDEAIELRQQAAEVLRQANLQLSAEIEARTAERDRLRSLFKQAPGFMCVLGGPEHTYELLNESYLQLVGHRDLVGKPIRSAMPELAGQGFFELLDEVRRTGVPFIGRGMRAMLQRQPGAPLDERFLNFIYQPILAPSGAVDAIFAEGSDVTDQIRAERALLELNGSLEARIAERTSELGAALQRLRSESAEREVVQEALRQSQKMEAVGQLTGGIAHDFNNLLQGITGSLSLIRRRLEQGRPAEVERFISDASNSAKRAAALTHRLLAFSRRQPLDPKPVRANPLICSMEDLLRRTLGERITLKLALAGDLWVTLCDANQLENALLNLCINARDAMPDGGALTLTTANAVMDEPAARGADVSPGPYVCISVSDTGIGMAAETLTRAFEPFFTTKPLGQGTGLGLSMIYGFTRQSEGCTRIHSELGKGATVRLYLPRHADETEAAAETAEHAEHEPHPTAAANTVLVVEDEAVVRGLIVEVLKDLGYQALEAADGPTGLQVILSRQQIDLLVTDIGLPGLNGRQVADAARVHRPGLKVLLMTGYAESAASAGGVLSAGMQLMTKPFAVEDFAQRVRAMMQGG